MTRPAQFGMPASALEALAAWDRGESVWTIEMGGLSPGYEQTIQMLVMELVRDHCAEQLPSEGDALERWGDDTVARTYAQGEYSGAQVGAAKALAYRAIRRGWSVTVQSAPADRRIQVSRRWPHIDPPLSVSQESRAP